jgi:hypothetical protein
MSYLVMQAIKVEKIQAEIDALKASQTWQPIEGALTPEYGVWVKSICVKKVKT